MARMKFWSCEQVKWERGCLLEYTAERESNQSFGSDGESKSGQSCA